VPDGVQSFEHTGLAYCWVFSLMENGENMIEM
jgi:hypothetical protein